VLKSWLIISQKLPTQKARSVQERKHAAFQVSMMTLLHRTEDIGMSAPQLADTQVNWAQAAGRW
jgi:hypothetical protein